MVGFWLAAELFIAELFIAELIIVIAELLAAELLGDESLEVITLLALLITFTDECVLACCALLEFIELPPLQAANKMNKVVLSALNKKRHVLASIGSLK